MAELVIEKIDKAHAAADLFSAMAKHPYSFFLDSALRDKKMGRFSFLGCDPFLIFKSKGDLVTLEYRDGKKENFRSDPFSALSDIFRKYARPPGPGALPFTSGGVGYFSYDMKDFVEELPDIAVDDLALPDCVMGFYDSAVIYDNLDGAVYISGSPARLKELKNIIGASAPAKNKTSTMGAAPLESNFSKSDYISAIKKAKQYIKKGDIYQVNISQRFETEISVEPSLLYSRLRDVSPAPFASYLGFGDLAILSSSPERFLLKRGGYIETRPIKGTRPRGDNRARDLELSDELVRSAKDNAEHIMIVDLERNDLGRICEYGTVKPAGRPYVEKYSNVFHLVSTVSGRLNKDVDPIKAMLAAFPGGSITGAPKVRSMEIIEELEPVKRSIYTGAIGYISFDGNMDTSIVIRTLIAKGRKAYFSVGGGIVADSDPEAEYQETLDKAAGIMKALGNI